MSRSLQRQRKGFGLRGANAGRTGNAQLRLGSHTHCAWVTCCSLAVRQLNSIHGVPCPNGAEREVEPSACCFASRL